MRLKIEVDSGAVLKAFGKAPKETRNELRVALKKSLRDIQGHARQTHKFKSRSGSADRAIDISVKGNVIQGMVFLNEAIAKYAPFLHRGTGIFGKFKRPIQIKPKNKRALRFSTGGGFAYSMGHSIKGIKGEPFLYDSAKKKQSRVQSYFNSAVQNSLVKAGLIDG